MYSWLGIVSLPGLLGRSGRADCSTTCLHHHMMHPTSGRRARGIRRKLWKWTMQAVIEAFSPLVGELTSVGCVPLRIVVQL